MLLKAVRQFFFQIRYEVIQGTARHFIDMVMYFYIIKQVLMKFRIKDRAVHAENGQEDKQAEACQHGDNHV